MTRSSQGFTLLEMLIVIAVIAIVASIAIPNVLAGRLAANETAAIGTIRSLVAAQVQFRDSAALDVDHDGTGEFGGLLELSGAREGRMARRLVPAVLSGSFRVLDATGAASRSGYLFQIVLPDEHGAGIPEPRNGFTATDGVDTDLAETTWCVYAWPGTYAKTGRRSFFTNQKGDLFWTETSEYSGPQNAPAPDAAFDFAGDITGNVASGAASVDGNIWKQLD